MNRKINQEKLAKQISLAIMAGMVTYTPVAFGMPTGGVSDTANIPTTYTDSTRTRGGETVNVKEMAITSDSTNNVINWTDFSVGTNEAVKFDGKNYANIVNGSATSMIDGFLEGGGKIYLINPNGVIFGKTAQVNVGNLYVSTQGKVDTSKFNDQEANPVLSVSGTPACDVVNLGTIKADTVEVVGNNIRFLNAENIHADSVTIKTDGYVHLGHAATEKATTYDEGDVKEYAAGNASLIGGKKVGEIYTAKNWDGYSVTNLKNEARDNAIDNYLLVRNEYELQNMRGNAAANYMLADHINKGVTAETVEFAPIDNFSGKFDGMFYTINKLEIKRKNGDEAGHTGLFASTFGADVRIENVGIVDSAVYGYDNKACGAIIGNSTSAKTTLKNVYATGTSVSERSGSGEKLSKYGGLVGHNSAGDLIIDTAFYDGGTSSGCVGSGIIGYTHSSHSVQISDVYSQGTIKQNGIAGKGTPAASISNAYTSADKIMGNTVPTGTFTKLTDSSDSSYKQKKVYSDVNWDISDVGGVTIDDKGNVKKSKWRIYAGQSLPVLTAFFKGTVQADYTYSMGDSVSDYTNKTSNETIGISADKQGNVTAIYNGGTVQTGGVSALKHLTDEQKALISYAGDKKKAEKSQDDTTTNYALFFSTQQGYDIAGSNFTITKRKVQSVGGDVSLEVSREYQKNAVYDASGTTTGTLSTAKYGLDGKLIVSTGVVKEDQDTVGMSGVSETFYSLEKIGKTTLDDCDYWFDHASETEKEAAQDGTVGRNKYVRLTYKKGAALSGAGSENYELISSGGGSESSSVNGMITPKTLTLTKKITGDITKVYDGETTLEETYKTIANVFDLDTTGAVDSGLTVDGKAPSEYSGSDAGTYDLTYSELKLNNNNYRLSYDGNIIYCGNADFAVNADKGASIGLTGKITPREVSIADAIKNVTKVYDGNADATVDGVSFTLNTDTETGGIVAKDKDKLIFTFGTNAKFTDGTNEAKDVDTAINVSGSVSVANATPSEDVLKNYQFTDADNFTGTGNITARDVYVTLKKNTGVNKDYDGTETVAANYKNFGENESVYYAGASVTDTKKQLVDDASAVLSIAAEYEDKYVHRNADGEVLEEQNTIAYTIAGKNTNYNVRVLDGTQEAEGGKLTATGTINPKVISIAFDSISKEYDATSDVDKTKIIPTVDGLVGGDTFDKSKLTALYGTGVNNDWKEDANVGDAKKIKYTGLQSAILNGTENVSDSYTFDAVSKARIDDTKYGDGVITPLTISKDDLTIQADKATKTYDRGTAIKYDDSSDLSKVKEYLKEVSVTKGEKTINLLTNADDVSLTNAVYTADSAGVAENAKNAGDNKKVSYTIKLGDNIVVTDSSDKSVTKELSNAGTIYQKKLELVTTGEIADVVKVYDGTTDVKATSIEGKVGLDGVIDGDTVVVSSTSESGKVGDFESKDVFGDDPTATEPVRQTITYDLTKFDIGGADAGNYYLDKTGSTITGHGTITQRTVNVSVNGEPSRAYNGSAAVDNAANYIVAEAATDKTGFVNGETWSDTSKITGLYGSGTTVQSFQENGDASDEKKDVQYTIGDGAVSRNYTIATTVLYGQGEITKRDVNAGDIVGKIVFSSVAEKEYDNTTELKTGDTANAHINNGTGIGLYDGDKLLTTLQEGTDYTVSAAFDGAGSGTDKTVNYTITFLTDGNVSKNLNISGGTTQTKDVNSITAQGVANVISPRKVIAEINENVNTTKVYDGSDVLKKADGSDYEPGSDLVTFRRADGSTALLGDAENTSSASYNEKNAGDRIITYTASVNDADAANYAFTDAAGNLLNNNQIIGSGKINQKTLTVTVKDTQQPERSYNVSSAVDNASNYVEVTGFVTGEDFADKSEIKGAYGSGSTDATFRADPNAAESKDIKYYGFGEALGEANKQNYTIAETVYGKGKISKLELTDDNFTVKLSDDITKIYNADVDVQYYDTDTGTYSSSDEDKAKYLDAVVKISEGNVVKLQVGQDYDLTNTAYEDKNFGENNKKVNYEIKLRDSGNFDISSLTTNPEGTFTATTTNATIQKKALIVTPTDAKMERDYSGDANVVGGVITQDALNGKIQVTGFVVNDDGSPKDYAAKGDISAVFGSGDSVGSFEANGDVARNADYSVADKDILYTVALTGTDAQNYVLTTNGTQVLSDGNKLIGSGKILPVNVTVDFGAVEREYNGSADVRVTSGASPLDISPTISGTVNSEVLQFTTDAKNLISAQYGTMGSDGFQADGNVRKVGDTVASKGVQYSNIDAAWNKLIKDTKSSTVKASNYTLTDVKVPASGSRTITPSESGIVKTVYFDEAAEKGKILPFAMIANDIKAKWDNLTKTYDGKRDINEGTLKLVGKNSSGAEVDVPIIYTTIADELAGTGYSDKNHGTGKTINVAVTLDTQTLGDNFTVDDASAVNRTWASTDAAHNVNNESRTGTINQREVYVEFNDGYGNNDVSKTYDGTNVVFPDTWTDAEKQAYLSNALGLQVRDDKQKTGVVEGEDVKLDVSGMTVAYSSADVAYDNDDNVTSQNVSYSGFALTNNDDGNYVIKAVKKSDTDPDDKLFGTGTIKPQELRVDINNRDIEKPYDSTKEIKGDSFATVNNIGVVDGAVTATYTIGQQTVQVVRGTVTNNGNGNLIYSNGANTVQVNLALNSEGHDYSAEYDSANVVLGDDGKPMAGIGINYYLKWDNANFTLVKCGESIELKDSTKLSATLRGENMGTITQREIQVVDVKATKPYDGTTKLGEKDLDIAHMQYKDLTAGGTVLNHDTVIVGNDTIDSLELFATGGEYAKSDAARNDTEEYDTTNTVSGVTIATNNKNYKIIGNTSGQGIITRREITAAPTNIITDPGETPQFSGTMQNVLPKDSAMQEDFVWDYDGDYHDVMDIKGKYDVYAYYKDASGNKGAVADGNYGLNYKIKTQSANEAWQVGNKPAPVNPVDPSNPDSPYSPLNPNSPFRPNSDMNTAIAQASKFKPDDKSYNRASHDDNIEHFGQQSAISIQYEDAGVNVGDEEAVVGKRSLIGIESAGNVVNLGDAEMRAGNIGIENNGTNLGSAAEQAAIEAGLPATESYEAVPVVATAEQEDAVVESPFLSRLRQGQNAASDESNGEVSTGISIITAEPEDEDEEEKKNRAALMARSDRETHIGIETIGGGVNMAAAVR